MRRTCARFPGGPGELSTGAQAADSPRRRSTRAPSSLDEVKVGTGGLQRRVVHRQRATRGEREDGVKEGPGGREAGARRGRARRKAKESRRARRQTGGDEEREEGQREKEGWKEREGGRGTGVPRTRGTSAARARLPAVPRLHDRVARRSCETRETGRQYEHFTFKPCADESETSTRARGRRKDDAPLSFFFSSTKTFSGSVTICVRESCVSSTSLARHPAGPRQVRDRGA